MELGMKKAYAKGLRELITKMRTMEARSDDPEEMSESPEHQMAEEEGVEEFLEPMMEGVKPKPGVMAEDGEGVYENEEDLEDAKKTFFRNPISRPVKGKTRSVIMSMTMKSPDKGKLPPTKRHLG